MTTTNNYAERLLNHIGPAEVEAVRALDAGGEPRAIWFRFQEAKLSPALAGVMALVREAGRITSAGVAARWPDLDAPAVSNRLASLERMGLLLRVGQETAVRGGRRFVYQAWDVSEH